MKNINRRENPRIEIKLRCHITSPALWPRDAMYTENISRTGVLIAWCAEDPQAVAPRPGQIMTVEIELPAHHGFGQKCIHCQGTIMRVAAAENGGHQVAMTLTYMDFRSFNDRFSVLEDLAPVVTSWMA